MDSKNTELEGQEGGIRWDMFPKATARAYQGVLEELSTSTFDRDPDVSQVLHDKVEHALKESYRSNRESNYEPSDIDEPLGNRYLSRYFEDLAQGKTERGEDPDLIPELELLADIARALYKPRRQ